MFGLSTYREIFSGDRRTSLRAILTVGTWLMAACFAVSTGVSYAPIDVATPTALFLAIALAFAGTTINLD